MPRNPSALALRLRIAPDHPTFEEASSQVNPARWLLLMAAIGQASCKKEVTYNFNINGQPLSAGTGELPAAGAEAAAVKDRAPPPEPYLSGLFEGMDFATLQMICSTGRRP